MTKNVLLGIAAMMTACLSACKEYDITQNFSKDTHYADDFIEEFGDPDPTHNWSMVVPIEVEAQFALNEEYEGGYMKVYTSDPYSADGHILASHIIDSEFIRLPVEAPKDLSCLYVVIELTSGYIQYRPVEIVDGKCKTSFGFDPTISNARSNFNTNATDDVKYWEGKVPKGQYEQVVPDEAVTVEGTISYIDNNTYPGKQYIHLHNADINNMNFWMGVNIYVTGHVTVERWYTGTNTNIYVLEGAELILPDNADFEQSNTTFTICDNAQVYARDYFKIGQGNTLYNNGEIYTGGFELCNDAIVYNDEKIEVDNAFSLKNGASCFVNNGTLRANDCSVEGSGSFYNSGIVTMRGTSIVNSNNSTWYNRGHYTTSNLTFESASPNWINECYLKVTKTLYVNLGDGSNLPVNNSYVETQTLDFDNGGMVLGPNAQLIVKGSATVNFNPYPRNRGIISTATGDDWSVFKAEHVVQKEPYKAEYISYAGNLIVDCSDHFAQGYSGQYPYIYIIGNAKFAPGGDNYSIPGSDCNEPYNAEVPTPPVDNPQSWIMACEDLGGTYDYDFNDVVFSISHLPGENFATVKPLAAGGTLASVLCYKNVPIKGNVLDSEIHYMLNYSATTISGSYNMLNSGKGQSTKYSGSPVKIILDNPNASIEDIAKLITVHVIARDSDIAGEYSVSQIVTRPEPGAMPQIILVPDTWIWPIEKASIRKAYPGFENWVKDATESDWASTADNNYLVKNY